MRGKANHIRLLLCVLSLTLPAQAQYGGGTGESNNPYLIYTAEQMNAIGAEPNDWDKHFKLMADIDLSKYTEDEFNIIGYYVSLFHVDNKFFTGIFDGENHKISNFNYTSTDKDCIGLFRCVDTKTAQIKDLRLIDPNVDAGTGSNVGSLVGYLRDVRNESITGCCVEGGCVSGSAFVGGLVGRKHCGLEHILVMWKKRVCSAFHLPRGHPDSAYGRSLPRNNPSQASNSHLQSIECLVDHFSF
jgi:hypothetical protein